MVDTIVLSDFEGRAQQLRQYTVNADGSIKAHIEGDNFIFTGDMAKRLSPMTDVNLTKQLLDDGRLKPEQMVMGNRDLCLFTMAEILDDTTSYLHKLNAEIFAIFALQGGNDLSLSSLLKNAKQRCLAATPQRYVEWFDDCLKPEGEGSFVLQELHRFVNGDEAIPTNINKKFVTDLQKQFFDLDESQQKLFFLEYLSYKVFAYPNGAICYQLDAILTELEDDLMSEKNPRTAESRLTMLNNIKQWRMTTSPTAPAQQLVQSLNKLITDYNKQSEEPLPLFALRHGERQIYKNNPGGTREYDYYLQKVFDHFQQFLKDGAYYQTFSQISLTWSVCEANDHKIGLAHSPGYASTKYRKTLPKLNYAQIKNNPERLRTIQMFHQPRNHEVSAAAKGFPEFDPDSKSVQGKFDNTAITTVITGHKPTDIPLTHVDNGVLYIFRDDSSKEKMQATVVLKDGGVCEIYPGKLGDNDLMPVVYRKGQLQQGFANMRFSLLPNHRYQAKSLQALIELRTSSNANFAKFMGIITDRDGEVYALLQAKDKTFTEFYALVNFQTFYDYETWLNTANSRIDHALEQHAAEAVLDIYAQNHPRFGGRWRKLQWRPTLQQLIKHADVTPSGYCVPFFKVEGLGTRAALQKYLNGSTEVNADDCDQIENFRLRAIENIRLLAVNAQQVQVNPGM